MTVMLTDDNVILAKEVILLIETEGMSMRQACEAVGMPKTSFIETRNQSKEISDQYARAIITRTDEFAEQIIDIADSVVPMTDSGSMDSTAVQDKRVRIDTRKWLMAKMQPKKFGDSVDVTSGGEQILAMLPVFPQKKIEGSDVG
jgi:hypothetical protein